MWFKCRKFVDLHSLFFKAECSEHERIYIYQVEYPDNEKGLERLVTDGGIALLSNSVEYECIASRVCMKGKVNMALCPNEGVHFHSALLCTSKGKIFLVTRSL
jgi:hypothetical protein